MLTCTAMRRSRRGATMIGLLVTMLIIVVLGAIALTAMKGAIGGSGTQRQPNQVMTVVDQQVIQQFGKSLFTFASANNGRLPSPTLIAGDESYKDLDTTANFWSSMIAQEYAYPQMLISHNEESHLVQEYTDYDYTAYSPTNGTYWDPGFKADLHDLSHTSFAHLALYGERYRKHWNMSAPGHIPLLGNRGPENGVASVDSYACDRFGNWGGSFVYGDGHVEYQQTATPPSAQGDNYFSVESGVEGDDIIITFTKDIWPDGFEMQFD